jgi:hypothetical protein
MLLLTLTACHAEWTPVSSTTGERLESVEPYCREKAEASAARQIRFPMVRMDGTLDGLPADSRHDIVLRETAHCLETKGFKLVPADRYK